MCVGGGCKSYVVTSQHDITWTMDYVRHDAGGVSMLGQFHVLIFSLREKVIFLQCALRIINLFISMVTSFGPVASHPNAISREFET